MKNKKLSIIAVLPLLFCLCTGSQQKDESKGRNTYTYGNSTDSINRSSIKIDGAATYELLFSLAGETECFTIEIVSAFLRKEFPISRVPAKTYFIVEKVMNIEKFKSRKKQVFIPLAKNYNSEWDVFSPVKICRMGGDPLSRLSKSDYRIRFTTMRKETAYSIVTINSPRAVKFK